MTMDVEAHKKRHQQLHTAFDELLADWIRHVPDASIHAEIHDLMKWSHAQTENPTEEAPTTTENSE